MVCDTCKDAAEYLYMHNVFRSVDQGAREAKAIADEGVKVATQVMKQVVNERITGKKSSSSSSSSKSGGWSSL